MLGSQFSRLTPFERLLSWITSVRPGEGRIIFLMLAQIFLLLHSYYLIRPLRETLILTEQSPEVRAYATGAIAITLIFLVPLYKLVFERLDGNGTKSTMLTWVGAFFITNLFVFAFLFWLGIPIAVPFYIWVGIFSVMVIAQFWAFAADLFNVKTGQRLFAIIMVGAAAGAVTGSQVSGRLLEALGAANMMVLAGLLLIGMILIGRHAEQRVPEGSESTSPERPAEANGVGLASLLAGFNVVLRNKYLLLIAMFVLLANWISSTGGYILTSFLTEYATETELASGGSITVGQVYSRFWGDYLSAIAILQLILQLFIVSRLFRWFGIRGAILVLPLVMLANYGLIAMVPVFALVRLMMVIETSTYYSIHGTTNHALYLPVTREEKYVGKTAIDTFFWRAGDLVYAAMIFLTAQILGFEVSAVIYVNVALAIVMLALAHSIGKHHRVAARQSLDNLPPTLRTPLPDVFIPAGQMLVFSVPDQTFIDPDPGDTLNFHARLADGRPLPAWIQFDGYNQAFTVRPPTGSEGAVAVDVTATDFEGLAVHATFTVRHGPGSLPEFTAADEAIPPAQPSRGSDDRAGSGPPDRDFQA